MKRTLVFIIGCITMLYVAPGCQEEDPDPSGISGKVTNDPECLGAEIQGSRSAYPDTISCVHYQYDAANKKLFLEHFNAGFNCCPAVISCTIATAGDTIFIREKEKKSGCDCLCLYDLDLELKGIGQNKYWVKFIEPYAENQAAIEFEMDLTSVVENEVCVTRRLYPWGGFSSH